MKQYILCCLAIIILLISCKNKNSHLSALTASNLTSTFISLNADSAYNLKTPKGAIIKISKNSFDVSANTKVKLEVKEAYNMQDILLAGLSTTSNGKLLKSGGMIYINATADGNEVKILTPINISIPTKVYDDSMQLFKGEVKDDSTINWVDPQPLDSSTIAKRLSFGKALFLANCSSCHKPSEDFTGPELAFCRQREPDAEWAYRFTDNVNTMIERDPYAKALWHKFGSVMTQQTLTKEEIKDILDYCDNEGLSIPTNITAAIDTTANTEALLPCGYDTVYYPKSDTSIQILPADTTQIDNTATATELSGPDKAESTEGFRNGFTDKEETSGMYDFSIKTFGWYNIDYYVEGYIGTTYVNVEVQLQTQFEEDMNVYLFCPDKKMLSVAYNHDGAKYWFDKINGKIPLYLNDKAIILAFGSHGDKMFYGTSSFKVKTEQSISIQLKETTEDELKSFIDKNNIEGIEIDTEKKDFNIIKKPCNGYP
jgi:hypothetical protein